MEENEQLEEDWISYEEMLEEYEEISSGNPGVEKPRKRKSVYRKTRRKNGNTNT